MTRPVQGVVKVRQIEHGHLVENPEFFYILASVGSSIYGFPENAENTIIKKDYKGEGGGVPKSLY